MANRFYLLSSFCFLSGAVMAFHLDPSPINGLYVLGSLFFLIAAALGVFTGKRR